MVEQLAVVAIGDSPTCILSRTCTGVLLAVGEPVK